MLPDKPGATLPTPSTGDGVPSVAAHLGALRWAEALVAVGTLGLAALWLCVVAPGLRERVDPTLRADALLPLALIFGLVLWVAPAHAGLAPRVRRAWRFLALAVAAWWTAGVVWELRGRPALSWADPIQMLFFPLVLAAVLAFPGEPLDRGARRRFLLDAGLVVLSGAAGVWYFVLWPLINGRPDALIPVLVNGAYPLGDLVLLFAACLALQRRLDRAARRALAWVAAGLIFRFVGDLLYGWEGFLTGGYRSSGLSDLTWLTAVWALAVGATVQRRMAVDQAAHGPARRRASGMVAAVPDEPPPGVSVLPYASVVAVFAFLLVLHDTAGNARIGGVLLLVVAVTVLVLVRQFLAMRENAALLRERAARAVEARFRSLVQHASDVIVVVERDGQVRFASPSIERVLGLDPDALLGSSLMEHIQEDDRSRAAEVLQHAVSRSGTTGPGVLRLRRADGAWRTMECVLTNLLDDPTVGGVVVTARDISERAALEAQLVHQAFHDPLTGLANRTLLRDRVEHSLTRQARRPERVAVLFLDLDDFKTVNDSLGHAAGDRLLRVVAERLLNATRGCDTVARLGGDEFAVLLDHTRDDADAVVVAERILASLRAPVPLDGTAVLVGASVGIARAAAGDGADELLRNADVAMYRAKQQGKAGYELFSPEMHAALLDRLELETELRRAVTEEGCAGFRVLYQPIVRLEGGEASGVEALVRWQHPRRGLVTPADFIPLAESTGLIVPLGLWVLREACRQAAEWQRAREAADADAAPLTLTVNLSGRQLHHPTLAADVQAALDDAGLAPASLVLEITESVIMQDTAETLQTLHALRALGVRLAIDDFGTGYSSLGYLQQFPIDILKIDKSFVDNIATGGSEAALARTIVALGDTLALRCVAEGVEQHDQRRRLQDIGCEYGQGYLFARPMTAEAAGAVVCGMVGEMA